MDWVYNPPSDEPTIYEATADPPAHPPPFDLFAPAPPVEEPTSEPEPEYYGDVTAPDDLIAPEDAFKVFARSVNCSDELDESPRRAVPTSRPNKILFAESRAQRMQRIRYELAELKAESDEGEIHVRELERQLRDIEAQLALPQKRARVVETGKGEVNASREADAGSMSREMKMLSDLERRIFAVEQSVGTCRVGVECSGKDLARVLDDVKTRLELISDASVAEKMKKDAKEIAEILQREMQNEHGGEMVRMATVLEKMDKWEEMAEIVPIVVERLRSFKRLQTEAGGFAKALNRVTDQTRVLLNKSETNRRLVDKVASNLEENVKTIQHNLDLLQQKVQGK